MRVITVEDGGTGRWSRGAIKQFAFRGKVILHAAVVVKMVAGQIGEDGDVEPEAGNPLLIERVRGYLHHRLGRAAVHSLRETAPASRVIRG